MTFQVNGSQQNFCLCVVVTGIIRRTAGCQNLKSIKILNKIYEHSYSVLLQFVDFFKRFDIFFLENLGFQFSARVEKADKRIFFEFLINLQLERRDGKCDELNDSSHLFLLIC